MSDRRRKNRKEAEHEDVAGRALWSGTISFGLVAVPVYLFPANRPAGVALRMLDEDGTPLARRWWCPKDEEFLGADEIVRGYSTGADEFVVVHDEELEALEPRKSREIDLRRFVPVGDVDPRWFQRGYYLTPAGESTKAYRLLAEVMERTGRAGIATFVMRGHEYLVAILSARGILRAETLRFHDELRTAEAVGLPAKPKKVDAKEVRSIEKAIQGLTEKDLDLDELRDPWGETLHDLVETKRRSGEAVVEPAAPAEPDEDGGEVIDLMSVLKKSLRGAATGTRTKKGARKKPARDDLEERSREELYERAQELAIPGRSGMTKRQLLAAIRRSA